MRASFYVFVLLLTGMAGGTLALTFADRLIDPASTTGVAAVFAHGLIEIAREHRLFILFLSVMAIVYLLPVYMKILLGPGTENEDDQDRHLRLPDRESGNERHRD